MGHSSYLILRLRWNVGKCEMIQQSRSNVRWASLGDRRISQPTANIAWSMTYSMEWRKASQSVQILTRVGSLLHLLLGRLRHSSFDACGLQLSSDSLLYTSSSSNIRCFSNRFHSRELPYFVRRLPLRGTSSGTRKKYSITPRRTGEHEWSWCSKQKLARSAIRMLCFTDAHTYGNMESETELGLRQMYAFCGKGHTYNKNDKP